MILGLNGNQKKTSKILGSGPHDIARRLARATARVHQPGLNPGSYNRDTNPDPHYRDTEPDPIGIPSLISIGIPSPIQDIRDSE